MGLEQVITEVRRDGEERAQRILDDARAEAQRVLDDARSRADAYAQQRAQQAEKDAAQLASQMASGAEFEARKQVLKAESAMRDRLREELLQGFAGLPKDIRKAHIQKLLRQAREHVRTGKVWSAPQDRERVEGAEGLTYAGSVDIEGGIIVENEDGTNRLDLSYATLLSDLWRDILKAESDLFA